MLGAEIIGKNFDDVLDVPDHLELHESQKVVRPKMKEKTRNKVSYSLFLGSFPPDSLEKFFILFSTYGTSEHKTSSDIR